MNKKILILGIILIILGVIFTVFLNFSSTKKYMVLVSKVDEYSPDRYLTVYCDNEIISVKNVAYSDGVSIISKIDGERIVVSYMDIEGENKLLLTLLNDNKVLADIKNE